MTEMTMKERVARAMSRCVQERHAGEMLPTEAWQAHRATIALTVSGRSSLMWPRPPSPPCASLHRHEEAVSRDHCSGGEP